MCEGGTGGTDLTWLLTHGVGMAWQYAMEVQTALTDMEAAYRDGNYPVCVESCAVALRAIAYCWQVGEGYVQSPDRVEHHLHLAGAESATCQALRALPSSPGATSSQAEEAMATVRAHDERIRAEIPLTVPVIRSAGGYFPTIRIARALERLRSDVGLGPVDWEQWGI